MITPHKYLDLDNSVIYISAIILEYLLKKNGVKYDTLYNHVIKTIGEDSKYLMRDSLNFLFLLGKIEYYKENDNIVLTR